MRYQIIVRVAAVLVFALAAQIPAADYGPNVRVQIIVEEQTQHGVFRDAIYVSKAEFDALSNAQVAAMKQARVQAWVAAVEDARTRPAIEPTRAELEAELTEVQKRAAELEARIAARAAASPSPTPRER